jgi:uncharacterized protein
MDGVVAIGTSKPAHRTRRRYRRVLAGYGLGLAVAEVTVTAFDARWGIVLYGGLVALTVLRAIAAARAAPWSELSVVDTPSGVGFYMALSLLALLRITSLVIPLDPIPEVARKGVVAVAILSAAFLAARAAGYERRSLGLRFRWSWRAVFLDLGFGALGIALGYLQYQTLEPVPLIHHRAPTVLGALALFFLGVGFVQEFVFRGVIRHALDVTAGSPASQIYGAIFFAILHVGYRSLELVALAFIFGLVAGSITRFTGSLVGATLASGVAGFCLFVAFPLVQPHPLL